MSFPGVNDNRLELGLSESASGPVQLSEDWVRAKTL